jgi:hypothetical protein
MPCHFGISRIANPRCKNSLTSRTPILRIPIPRTPTPRDPLTRVPQIDGCDYIEESQVAISPVAILLPRKTPNPDSSGSCATCPRSDRRLPLIRGIATRDFNEHETLASSNAEARYADIRWPVPFCAFGLTPAQLLHDPTVSGISRFYLTNPGR